MTTIEKAQISFDPEEITKGRAAVKRKFTMAINSLQMLVQKIDDPTVDIDTVSRTDGSEFDDIKTHYKLLGDINDRLVEVREENPDKIQEEAQLKTDGEYILKVKEEI